LTNIRWGSGGKIISKHQSVDCGGDREDEAFMGGVRWGRALNGKNMEKWKHKAMNMDHVMCNSNSRS
jgi:hypothetical protein